MKTKALLILSAALGAGTSVYADKVTFSATPPAVQQAIKARSGSHEIEDIDRDYKNGQTTYEASWKNNSGIQQELLVSDNGSVLRDVAGDGPAAASQSSGARNWRPRFGTADQNIQISGGVKLPMNQAPQAVQDTVSHMARGAQIEDFERGTYMANNRTVYKATFKRNGQNIDLQVYDDGSLVRRSPFGENNKDFSYNSGAQNSTARPSTGFGQPRYAGLVDHPVALTQLKGLSLNQAPPAVQSTVNYMASGAQLKGFESGYWNGRLVYDAQYNRPDGNLVELQVLEDGSILPKDPTSLVNSSTTTTPSKRQDTHSFWNNLGNRLGLGSDSTSGAASTTSMSLSQTPAAVQQTVNNVTKGAALQSLQQEQWNGRTVYDASFQQNSQNMRLQVLDDGSILNMGPATAVGAPASSQTGSGYGR